MRKCARNRSFLSESLLEDARSKDIVMLSNDHHGLFESSPTGNLGAYGDCQMFARCGSGLFYVLKIRRCWQNHFEKVFRLFGSFIWIVPAYFFLSRKTHFRSHLVHRFNQAKPKTETETKMYEILSHKNWGASSSLMNEIARDTYDFDKFGIITTLLW